MGDASATRTVGIFSFLCASASLWCAVLAAAEQPDGPPSSPASLTFNGPALKVNTQTQPNRQPSQPTIVRQKRKATLRSEEAIANRP